MQAPVEITLSLKKVTDLEKLSLDVLEGRKNFSQKQIETVVDAIKNQFDCYKEYGYQDDLLVFYFHLTSALYYLSYYYDSPRAQDRTKETTYANLAEDYLKYFLVKYKQHYSSFISQPNKNPTAYYKLALLYKIRALLCIRRKTTVEETIKYFSLALRMLYHCYQPQQLALLPQNLKLPLLNHLSEVLANFLNFIEENHKQIDLTDSIADNMNKCFGILQSPDVINDFVSITLLKARISVMPTYRNVNHSLAAIIDFLLALETDCIRKSQYDLSLNILASTRICVNILGMLTKADHSSTMGQAGVVAEVTQTIDFRIGYNHYSHACHLLQTSSANSSVTFDVLYNYIKNGSCPIMDNILNHFKQAKRVTQRKAYHDINFADVYEGVFKELLATFAAQVRNLDNIVIDIYKLKKKITKFFLQSGNTAYKNKQYDVAKNLYLLAMHTLPVVSERPQTSTHVYAQAAYMFIQFNICRCLYHKELTLKPIMNKASANDININLQYLNIYFYLLEIWHIIQVAPTTLAHSRQKLLNHEPALFTKLQAHNEGASSTYAITRAHVLYQSMTSLPAEEKRKLCDELDVTNFRIKEMLPSILKKVFDNLLTPAQQQFVLANGLVIDDLQMESIESATAQLKFS